MYFNEFFDRRCFIQIFACYTLRNICIFLFFSRVFRFCTKIRTHLFIDHCQRCWRNCFKKEIIRRVSTSGEIFFWDVRVWDEHARIDKATDVEVRRSIDRSIDLHLRERYFIIIRKIKEPRTMLVAMKMGKKAIKKKRRKKRETRK